MQKRIKFVHMLIVLCKAKLYIADIIIAYNNLLLICTAQENKEICFRKEVLASDQCAGL